MKHLEPEVLAARVALKEQSAYEKAVAEAQLASENLVLRARLGEQKGRDKKHLDEEIEQAREVAGTYPHQCLAGDVLVHHLIRCCMRLLPVEHC